MATQNIKCEYCDKQLSNIYKLDRHIKTSKQCIKIQSLENIQNEFNYDNILRNFKFTHDDTTSYTYIATFITTYFINQNNYITTDKKRFIGKYIINNQIQNDIGFEFIKQIYIEIMKYISETNFEAFSSLKINKQFSKSKLSKLPAVIKNHIAENTYYKQQTKLIKTKIVETKVEETKVEPKSETYICPCDKREHCSSYEEKIIHRNTKKHLEYIQYLLDNELDDEYKKVKQIFTFKN